MPRKKHICPHGCGNEFYTPVHVMQEWKVDGYGNFIEVKETCLQVTHGPHDDNIWECVKCGATAFTVVVKIGGEENA